MRKVLLVCDRRDWAYDSIARALIKFNADPGLALEVLYLKQEEEQLRARAGAADFVFFLGWQLILEKKKTFWGRIAYVRRYPYIPDKKILTGIHSHHAWDDFRTLPDVEVMPPPALVKALRRFRGVNAVSRRLTDLFSKAGLDRCVYTPNGVDAQLFVPAENKTPHGDHVVVGFSGNKKHDFRKGVTEFIEPQGNNSWVRLKLAMPQGDHVPLDKMPSFYTDIDVYLCASSSEGFSLSVLEAASCGVPVVSTRVGGSEDMIKDGVNGFLVDRDKKAMMQALRRLYDNRELLGEMGRNNRREVMDNWDWRIRVEDWFDFMKG